VDGWSRGGPDADRNMTRCLTYLMQDPGAAVGALMLDRAPDGGIFDVYIDYMRSARDASGKPVALVSAWQGSGSDPLVVSATHAGMPVVDGITPFLRAVRALLDCRDFYRRGKREPRAAPARCAKRWQQALRGNVLYEPEALELLRDFGIDAVPARVVTSHREAVVAAGEMGWPVAVKTGAGIAHKSDRHGVRLNVSTEQELIDCVDDLQARLGEKVLVAPMASPGVEMIFGARNDPQFGPIVIVGFGGVHAEVLRDAAFALPPFDDAQAKRMFERLQLRDLLHGARGAPAVDVERLAAMASRFSVMVYEMHNAIGEVDVNPVIASADGCVAVDALIVGTKRGTAT
ncbi:MAG: acetate--CoA ligase family protein, partial [Gammaproteobacteria bacterium]|nr:acetate--CoA ligase family protein [Gammaproteobacteria bacterium]